MASLGHVAVGLCAARLARPAGAYSWSLFLFYSLLSLLPDGDVVAFALGVPYDAPFGHRGASHSLVAALLLGALAAPLAATLAAPRDPPTPRRPLLAALVLSIAVVASHGLLDALTDGGLGVALLWPCSAERYFAPLRPLPVAPIGARLLSRRGLLVMGTELLCFLPLFLYALWPRRPAAPASVGLHSDE